MDISAAQKGPYVNGHYYIPVYIKKELGLRLLPLPRAQDKAAANVLAKYVYSLALVHKNAKIPVSIIVNGFLVRPPPTFKFLPVYPVLLIIAELYKGSAFLPDQITVGPA